MYLIIKSLYPNDKAKEVAEMYLKAMTKYPPDASLETPVVPIAVRTNHEGVNVMSIHDIKKGKFEDAQTRFVNFTAMFNDIQGYRTTFETYLNLEEAMKSIGM